MAENKQQHSETGHTATGDKKAVESASAATKQATDRHDAPSGDSVKETLSKAKDAAGEAATQAAGEVKEKATTLLGDQKTNLAAGINSVADSIRQAGENLRGGDGGGEAQNQIAAFAGKYGDNLAEQVERISHYIEDRDLRELAQDVEKFARRNPAVFVGGAFALGILAARFLKSSSSRQSNAARRIKSSSNPPVQAS